MSKHFNVTVSYYCAVCSATGSIACAPVCSAILPEIFSSQLFSSQPGKISLSLFAAAPQFPGEARAHADAE
jgi:hypothetical protein